MVRAITRGLLTAVAVMVVGIMWSAEVQADSSQPVRFGVVMGLNHSTRYGDLTDMEWVNGIVGGVSLRVVRPHRPWVEFQMLYSRKGSAWEVGGLDFDLQLAYLEMPVLFGIPLQLTERTFFEPRVGFALAHKVDEELTIDGSPFSSHYFKDWDLGAVLGASIRREVTHVGLSFEVRYTIGLLDIDDPADTEFRGSDRNRSVSFLIGAAF